MMQTVPPGVLHSLRHCHSRRLRSRQLLIRAPFLQFPPACRYINTMANMLAPRLVQPHLKATAAGLMAITYQTAHFLGLVIATMAAILLYGDIGVK